MLSLVLRLLQLTDYAYDSLSSKCRNQPGDKGFPSHREWNNLNMTIGGRLLSVVPSAKFCHELPGGFCTREQWVSTQFRKEIPGSMDTVSSSMA